MSTALLHPRLRNDVEWVAAANAGISVACAAILVAVPSAVIDLFNIVGVEPVGLRLAALPFVVVGLAAGVASRMPIRSPAVGALAVGDGLIAVGLVLGPLVLGLRVGALGWLAVVLLFFVYAAAAMAWFFVRDRIVDAQARALRSSAGAPVAGPGTAASSASGGQELLVER